MAYNNAYSGNKFTGFFLNPHNNSIFDFYANNTMYTHDANDNTTKVKSPLEQLTQKEREEYEKMGKFGKQDKWQASTQGLANLTNIGLGIWGAVQTKDKLDHMKRQQEKENARYDAQIARNKEATDNTANTASLLKGAATNMQGTRPEPQPATQEPPPPPQEKEPLPLEAN